MSDLRSRRMPQIEVNGSTLLWYASVTLLFYSISMSVIQNGMLHIGQYSNAQLRELLVASPDLMLLSGWAAVFQLLGGLSIPVFAFLTTEEFLHTKSYRNDLLCILGFALLSEIPFDLAMSGRAFDWTSQNMLFSLAIGLVMLYGLRLFAASKVVQALIVVAAVFWCSLMKTGFGLCMVLLMAIYYLLREKPGARLIWSSLVSLMYITGPVSNFVLKRYNGQTSSRKKLFLCLYPLHLLALAAVVFFLKISA